MLTCFDLSLILATNQANRQLLSISIRRDVCLNDLTGLSIDNMHSSFWFIHTSNQCNQLIVINIDR